MNKSSSDNTHRCNPTPLHQSQGLSTRTAKQLIGLIFSGLLLASCETDTPSQRRAHARTDAEDEERADSTPEGTSRGALTTSGKNSPVIINRGNIGDINIGDIINNYHFDRQFGPDAKSALVGLVGYWKNSGPKSLDTDDLKSAEGGFTISPGNDGFLYIEGNATAERMGIRGDAGYTYDFRIPRTRLPTNGDDDAEFQRSFTFACDLREYSIDGRGRRDRVMDTVWKTATIIYYLSGENKNRIIFEPGGKISKRFVFTNNR
jgi:hypothetical protein